jgi:sec-independent protein translocase protein TatA
MFGLDAPELIIIAIVILVLFGSKKLPDAARSLGRSMRIFKAETRGMRAEDEAAALEAGRAETPAAGTGTVVTGEPVSQPTGEPADTPVNEPHAGSEPR